VRLDDFWVLIHRSSVAAGSLGERAEWLTGQLAAMPVPAIVEFELHLVAQRKRADTWQMWGAAWIIMGGGCSDDGFFYFRPWLVGLGREVFGRAVADPDSLAGVPQIRRLVNRPGSGWPGGERPDWELLNYVARIACERATGDGDALDNALEAQGVRRVSDNDPQDDPWDFEDPGQRLARLPRLSALLG
jgi:hypothetical protein